MSSSVNIKVDTKMKSILQLAKKTIIDNIELEIEKAEDEEVRETFINRLTFVLEGELKIIKNNNSSPFKTFGKKNIPTAPVKVRGTNLYLKNMANSDSYNKFCTDIANKLGYESDFSNAPFAHIPKNNRVYEAIKILHFQQGLSQHDLDMLVIESETNS